MWWGWLARVVCRQDTHQTGQVRAIRTNNLDKYNDPRYRIQLKFVFFFSSEQNGS
jgi:hypothetical protein